MKNFVTLSPSGNITALVLDEVNGKDYRKISSEILKKYKNVEQVGFLKKDGNLFRLEMMGMEFCGNASRAFACFLVASGRVGENEFYFSTSGIEKSVFSSVKKVSENKYFSSVKIPISENICERKSVNNIEVFVVNLDGITHVLVDKAKYDFDEAKAAYFIDSLGLRNLPAVGVVWFDGCKIQPVVWVRDTDTYYYENSCGSGSLALGIYYASLGADRDFDMIQKNGEIISISIGENSAIIAGITEII